MNVVIQSNTSLPAKGKETFETVQKNQREIRFRVFEGEKEMCDDNAFLGKFTIPDLPKGAKGEVKVAVAMELDEENILNITASMKGRPTMKVEGLKAGVAGSDDSDSEDEDGDPEVIELAFLIDCTWSMSNWVEEAKKKGH